MPSNNVSAKPRRWRLTWWLVGETIPRQAQWYSHVCKLCAAKRALSLGEAYASVKLAPREAVRWEVSRMDLHGGESVIVATSGLYGRELVKRHAHRESGTGAVRTTVRARGPVSEGGSEGVPGVGWQSRKLDVVSASRRNGKNGKRS